MNLRALAEADNEFLLEDDVNGFAVAVRLTDLAGRIYDVKGQYHRVGVDIDPETGLLVPGNKSGITVRLIRFPSDNPPSEDWTIETTDIAGSPVKGKANSVMLDRTAGRATLIMRR